MIGFINGKKLLTESDLPQTSLTFPTWEKLSMDSQFLTVKRLKFFDAPSRWSSRYMPVPQFSQIRIDLKPIDNLNYDLYLVFSKTNKPDSSVYDPTDGNWITSNTAEFNSKDNNYLSVCIACPNDIAVADMDKHVTINGLSLITLEGLQVQINQLTKNQNGGN